MDGLATTASPGRTAAPVTSHDGPAVLLRRPLLLAVMLGAAVSMLASGRFTLRLIVDAGISMAFVPACQILGLAAIFPFRRTPVSFARAADRFFAGNTVWLAWIWVFMMLGGLMPVTSQAHLTGPFLASSILPIAWSLVVDRRFFADVMGHTAWGGAVSLVIERLVAWSAAVLYFFGVASDGRFGKVLNVFVEIWEVLVAWVTS